MPFFLRISIFATLLASIVSPAGARAGTPLSPEDIEDLRQLDQQQVRNWLDGDRKAVWESLTDDAVFIPHHGVPPKSGAELENFWWPEDAPPFRIVDYWHRVTHIEGEDNYGIVYGRQNLVFDSGDERYTIGEGNYFIFAVRVKDEWKIKYIVISDPPNRVEPRPAVQSSP